MAAVQRQGRGSALPRRAPVSPTADRGPDLVVVGASVRAFAQSARRAGWRVHAADLFGDLDLAEAPATVVPARRGAAGYPGNLRAAVAGFPPAAWCYTGALENHPDLLAALAKVRPLRGAGIAAVRAARDVTIVGRAARAAGLRFPETRFAAAGVPRDGSFLVKPLAGAGGRGIERWTGATAARPRSGRCIWQRFVPGMAWSTSHVVSAAGAELLGASRQLLGRTWCAAGRFAWCGAIGVGVDELAAPLRRQFVAVGRMLVGLRLTGVVGVDLVVDRAGRAWVVEVNPRPTASMELVERATGRSIAAAHLAACGAMGAAVRAARSRGSGRPWTKAVLFAARATPIDAGMPDRLRALAATWERADGGWSAIADIPRPGQVIPRGGPLLTVLAPRGAGRDAVRPLRRRAAAVVRALSPPSGAAGRRGRRRAGTP
jgi:predicted ATP-grasp superfamily ATP-dependent carboligase